VSDGYGNAHVHWFGGRRQAPQDLGLASAPDRACFSTPHGVWVTKDNKVLVGDRENNRIQIFSADGTYLSEWGDLYHPMDIWGEADGTIYVTDQAPRIVAFSPTGEVLGRCKVGSPTHSHGLWGRRRRQICIGMRAQRPVDQARAAERDPTARSSVIDAKSNGPLRK